MSEHRVSVNNGKYTFVKEGFARIRILRHDEPWHAQTEAFNAIASVISELDAARVVLEAARKLGDAAPPEIKAALAKHAALVDDREPPSDWTK